MKGARKMEISLTSKLLIVFQSETDRKSAYDTLIAYRDACNHVSFRLFKRRMWKEVALFDHI